MKLLILLTLLVLGTIICNAQVMKFKAVQFICTRYQNQTLEPPEFKDLKDMPVEFNMDSSIFYIHSPTIQVFRLDTKPIGGSEVDSVMTYIFNGVDNKGRKCILTHSIYESESALYFAKIILEYPDKTYLYYLQKE